MWTQTLHNVAVAHGIARVTVTEQTQCVDRARLWRNWRNVKDNAAIRTAWHTLTTPFRPRQAP
jgi:hypothetical protein